ncbi:succinylglutamate desuccinylase/aspartoacylase family protein [Pelagibius sp. Alg239-R121]|uniref:succinylglutamate desuccinylase/aspartoacylase family protein n=1 Tax=Pelagibius sp. Alg239-R121 TaxID=2993448 RepID=UPI0024A68EEA|nr:succinylglutamate desuccinylase/aspartoacylase family protein [Pelagibius sp. Alg239-R121]
MADPLAEEIVVGGITVKPGERRIIDLPITDLSTHTPMSMPVQVICGRKPGPRLFVCAGLHGDEISGVEIIRRVLKLRALRSLRGTLIAVPIVNVFGFIALSRYLPDRRDLNRSFPGTSQGSLASRLANLFIEEVVAKCTHGIDLHTAAVHRVNYPQIRANLDDPKVSEMASSFGVPVVINASLRAGSLRQAAGQLGVPVIVYEAGEALRFDELSIRAGVKGVARAMRALNMLPAGKQSPRPMDPIIARSSTWVRAPASGVLRASFELGAQVRQDAVLGVISDPFGEREVTVTSPTDGIVIGRTNLPLVYEGDGLFHIVRVEGTQVVAETLDAFIPEEDYAEGLTAELADDPLLS